MEPEAGRVRRLKPAAADLMREAELVSGSEGRENGILLNKILRSFVRKGIFIVRK